ncbi:uncharacterized protein LOC112178065 [Rosa chinensis]|uniref:uncharacterized protein LOC112178065 n=1 Tax=Rosa chinensis TaxID=74649 RepID=UPI000D08ECA6|nr:uncharacterized protein LOC112178065 [Rosa chinensis]
MLIGGVKSIGGQVSKFGGVQNHHTLDSQFWGTKLPNKVKLCVWKALKGFFPIRSRLLSRLVDVPVHCGLCQQDSKVDEHLFRDCVVSRRILTPLLGQLAQQQLPFPAWLKLCMGVLSSHKRSELLVLLWSIWKARNDKVWHDKACDHLKVIVRAHLWLQNYLQVNRPPVQIGRQRSKWMKP